MARRDPFASALVEADTLLGQRELGEHVDERIFASVRRSSAPPRRVWLLAAIVPVVAALLYLVFGASESPSPTAAVPTVDGWTIRDASPQLDVRQDGSVVRVVSGTATFEDTAWGTVSNAGPVAFERASDGVRLIEGEATFAITHDRTWERPKRVVVSDGVIEIVGTRFTIAQGERGGEVTLDEGAIRFVDDVGTVELSPGEKLRWPRWREDPVEDGDDDEVEPAPTSSAAVAPPPPPAATTDASELMRKVEELRSRGRYDEAAELLRKADTAGDEATRERLSFERGSLLTYQRRDRERACAHWINHLNQYPHGRYGDDVHRALQHLKCGSKGTDP